jgi:hypothetical protein
MSDNNNNMWEEGEQQQPQEMEEEEEEEEAQEQEDADNNKVELASAAHMEMEEDQAQIANLYSAEGLTKYINSREWHTATGKPIPFQGLAWPHLKQQMPKLQQFLHEHKAKITARQPKPLGFAGHHHQGSTATMHKKSTSTTTKKVPTTPKHITPQPTCGNNTSLSF